MYSCHELFFKWLKMVEILDFISYNGYRETWMHKIKNIDEKCKIGKLIYFVETLNVKPNFRVSSSSNRHY